MLQFDPKDIQESFRDPNNPTKYTRTILLNYLSLKDSFSFTFSSFFFFIHNFFLFHSILDSCCWCCFYCLYYNASLPVSLSLSPPPLFLSVFFSFSSRIIQNRMLLQNSFSTEVQNITIDEYEIGK